MNNQEKYTEDPLNQYINPEMIEKAPEGFTSKVMAQIQMEPLPLIAAGRLHKRNPVPYISAAVTILLLAAAFIIPGNKSDATALPVYNLINNMKSSLPMVDLSSIFRLTIPSVLIYVFIGMLILSIFDRALYGIFHREK
jgi:hypothetical protein